MPPRRPQIPYVRVAAALRKRIEDREWLPGEPLPPVRDLGQEYEVSHTTVARAIKMLADEGLVTVIPSWGVFVAERA